MSSHVGMSSLPGHLLRSRLSSSLLDSVSRNFCRRILRRKQVKIFLSNLQLPVRSNDVGVLCVFVIKARKFPVRRSRELFVLISRDISKNCDLFNEILKGPSMNREARVCCAFLETGLFVPLEFSNPYANDLFQFRSGDVTKGSVLLKICIYRFVARTFFQAVSQSLAQVRELFSACISA